MLGKAAAEAFTLREDVAFPPDQSRILADKPSHGCAQGYRVESFSRALRWSWRWRRIRADEHRCQMPIVHLATAGPGAPDLSVHHRSGYRRV